MKKQLLFPTFLTFPFGSINFQLKNYFNSPTTKTTSNRSNWSTTQLTPLKIPNTPRPTITAQRRQHQKEGHFCGRSRRTPRHSSSAPSTFHTRESGTPFHSTPKRHSQGVQKNWAVLWLPLWRANLRMVFNL